MASGDESDDCEASRGPDPAGALTQVTLFALDHDEFRHAWEDQVRRAADRLTGILAGQRMKGAHGGHIEVNLAIPVPAVLGSEIAKAAFRLAVTGEVDRRIAAMTSPGEFG